MALDPPLVGGYSTTICLKPPESRAHGASPPHNREAEIRELEELLALIPDPT